MTTTLLTPVAYIRMSGVAESTWDSLHAELHSRGIHMTGSYTDAWHLSRGGHHLVHCWINGDTVELTERRAVYLPAGGAAELQESYASRDWDENAHGWRLINSSERATPRTDSDEPMPMAPWLKAQIIDIQTLADYIETTLGR